MRCTCTVTFFLTQQLIDMGKRVIVALNLMDEAGKNGIKVDVPKLTEMLGVPVIPTAAVKMSASSKYWTGSKKRRRATGWKASPSCWSRIRKKA